MRNFLKIAMPLGTVAGIPIRIHFTFFVLLALVGAYSLYQAAIIGLVFGCVLLHELGHALAARGFGIRTHDIVLYPIGGVARLQSMGDSIQEFWITLAGPAVNLVIAIGIFGLMSLSGSWVSVSQLVQTNGEAQILIWQQVAFANIVLFLFNLLPAFPMDGGRLLRSMLSGVVGRSLATRMAVLVGRVMSLLFVVGGVWFTHPGLLLVGVFIFWAAGAEGRFQMVTSRMEGMFARDAIHGYTPSLPHSARLGQAWEAMRQSGQPNLPVLDSLGQPVGVLTQSQLISGMHVEGERGYVGAWMLRHPPTIGADERMEKVFQLLQSDPGTPVVVSDRGRLIGLISNQSLYQFIFARRAAQ